MPRVLILGTGTAVGKTHVTVALARALTDGAAAVLARKPVETGVPAPQPPRQRPSARRGDKATSTDAAMLDAASTAPSALPHPFIALIEPVSPHLAARREGRRIALAPIVRTLDRELYATTRSVMSWQLVETAGGLFSPLSIRQTNLDLARALDPAIWVLVAHDGLGVLHDVRATLLALDAVARRRPDFLVLSAARTPDASTGTNAAELARLGLPRPVAILSRAGDAAHEIGALARALRARARR
jgi:dethiobiotin synthetase